MEKADSGANYEAFRAELAAVDKKMRRRDLVLRLSSMALLIWILVPRDDWSEKTGETLVFASGPMLSQVFMWLGWFQISAEGWVKNRALQLCIIAAYITTVFLVCDAVGSWLLTRLL